MLRALVAAAAVAALLAPAAGAGKVRTVLVVPKGQSAALRSAHLGARDCIAYPRACVNGVGGVELAYAVTGSAPARATAGTVLTDTNCNPDSYGVSHCLNRIRLASGRVLLVRHDHSMMNDPCLAPGEHVVVRAVGR